MRKSGLLLPLLALTTGMALAQQELPPSAEEGPLHIVPTPLQPDKDGVYSVGPGIVNPIVLERVAAIYPAEAAPGEVDGFSLLSLVIDPDGAPSNIQVLQSHGAAFDAAATEAVRQTKFEPGTLDGKPVPVRIYVRTRFFEDRRPAYPRVLARLGPSGNFGQFPGGNRFASRPFDKPPVALYAPAAEFSEQARAAKVHGTVVVSVLVTEDGMPTDLKVMKSLGMGLDENAIECVSQYRFKPAMKDGAPVEAHILVEVNFRLY